MKKPIIGVTRALAPTPVGDAYQEQLLFNYDGLGGLTVGIRASVGASVVCGAGTFALVAHRMPFILVCMSTFQCPHVVEYSV